MKKVSALIIVVSLTVLLYDISSFSADTGAVNIDLQKNDFADPNAGAIINYSYSSGSGVYLQDTFKKEWNLGSILYKNTKIELENPRPQTKDDPLFGRTLAVKSSFSLLNNLKISGSFEMAAPETMELGLHHFLDRDPFIERYARRQRHLSFLPTVFTDDSRPGLQFSLDYKPLKWLSFDIKLDRNWKDRFIRNNQISENRRFFTMSLTPFPSLKLRTGAELIDATLTKHSLINRKSYAYFAELSKRWRGYDTFIRYKMLNLEDEVNARRSYDADSILMGVKKNWTRVDEGWIRVGLAQKHAVLEESQYFAGIGVKYSPTNKIELQIQNSYEVSESVRDRKERMKINGEIAIELPYKLLFQSYVRMDRAVDGDTGYHLICSISRRFKS